MDTIITLYNNLKILPYKIEKIVLNLREQDYYTANATLKNLISELEQVYVAIFSERVYFEEKNFEVSEETIVYALKNVTEALQEQEYVLLADLFEQLVLPFLYQIQEIIVANEFSEAKQYEKNGRRYRVEYTSTGLATVFVADIDSEKGFYLHSNRNALSEAEILVKSWFMPEIERYIVFGMGLGYAVEVLLQKSEYCTVEVYESDSFLIELAKNYGCYKSIMSTGRAKVVADENAMGFSKAVQQARKEDSICFFNPAIRLIKERELHNRIEDVFINQASQKTQIAAMIGNFSRNSRVCNQSLDCLHNIFDKKRVFLIAGGPSLDKNMGELLNVRSQDIILTVGTVLKKLLRAEIRPDYVIFTSPKISAYAQVQGCENCGVPMLGLSTAYFRFFSDYHAEHYILCQEDFKEAEELAAMKGWPLIQTGGSVIVAALSTVLLLGASEVIFVGADLAFTDGKDHAAGTDYVAESIYGEQRMVKSITGEMIQTGKTLDIFRQGIERIIRQYPDRRFVDATEGGARIAGTELAILKDIVRE